MEDQVIFTEFLPVTVFCSLTSNLKLLTTTCGVKYCCNQFSPKEATFKPFFCQFNYKQSIILFLRDIKPLTFSFILVHVITQNPLPFPENVHRECEGREPSWKKMFFLWLFLLSVMKAKWNNENF